jgi:hypothetical protein
MRRLHNYEPVDVEENNTFMGTCRAELIGVCGVCGVFQHPVQSHDKATTNTALTADSFLKS